MGHITTEFEISTLIWPKPPYFNFVPNADKPALEKCIVELIKDRAHAGNIIRFSPEESRILFQPVSTKAHHVIAFDKIKNLQLLWPSILVREQNFLEARANEVFPPTEKQAYLIEFIDDTTITGETLGYVYSEVGLYIYPVLESGAVERHFIPRQSIKNYQIGLQIGEILLEENLVSADEIESALEHQKSLRAKRIGDYLNENQILTSDELHQAISHQEQQPVLKLGEALKELDLLTDEQLHEALGKQKENRNLRLGQILIDMGVVDERTLKGTLAKKLGIPYVNLTKFNFDPNAIRLINTSLAKKFTLMPLCIHDGLLVVAFEDPMNTKAIDEVRFVTQMKVLPAMASREDILLTHKSYYTQNQVWSSDDLMPMSGNSDGSIEFDFDEGSSNDYGVNDLASKLFDEDNSITNEKTDEPVKESDNTLVQLVNKMIIDAARDGVSDIHIETYPDKKNTVVRFRKDGSLMPYLEIPANFRNALISRIKIMSQLDISERRKPQDGKIDFQQFSALKVELRVATIPTSNGLEDVVMRILAASKPVAIDKIGLSDDALNTMKNLAARPYGLILVCGPTGSGKTTTLHSLMGHINTPERKIWTAEDPVEITQTGLRQVQVNAKIGWTFANAMRSFLRADPDVIMVGEMRDEETTKIGIEASLTGHLVLSTLHTNSAPESIVRMLDMGMDPFSFADALLAVLAQRLAKTLCKECKEAYSPDEAEMESLALEYVEHTDWDSKTILMEWHHEHAKEGQFTLYKAKGCKACNKTGYRGRLGLYELMTVTPTIRHMIQIRALVSELVHEALASGMHTLKQDGISKVLQGHTDIGQVRAVCS
jgi:type II secretory ATPase GspE/PulE/Tfp pilus assembly ATPase PilB-like protein